MKVEHPIENRIDQDDLPDAVSKFYKPRFQLIPPEEINVLDGKFVRLDVKASGLPRPKIEFLKDGKPIKQNRNHRIVIRENNIQSLLIDNANSHLDNGEYEIRASNTAGYQVVYTTIKVEAKIEKCRPYFIKKLQGPVRLAEGETLELEVQVKGNPIPNIGWKRDASGIIPDDERIVLEFDEISNSQKLTVFNVTKQDQGWYSCIVVNSSGMISSTCKIDVLEDWEIQAMNKALAAAENSNVAEGVELPHSKLSSDEASKDYDSPHLVVQKSSRLSHIQPEMREALRDAYSVEAQGPLPVYENNEYSKFTQ